MDDIDKKIQQGIETYMRDKQFNYSKIPAHEHNGIDTVKINEKDLIPRESFAGLITATSSGTLKITSILNPRSIKFYGFAADNYGGSPTKLVKINGEVIIGKATQLVIDGLGNLTPSPGTTAQFLQMSNSIYVDRNDLTQTNTTASAGSLAYGASPSGYVARITITEITQSYITAVFTLSSTWYIKGTFVIN